MKQSNARADQKELAVARKAADRPAYSLRDMMDLISRADDEPAYYRVKTHFDGEKSLYHPEQSLLIGAHLFGRFQYLQAAGKLAKVR